MVARALDQAKAYLVNEYYMPEIGAFKFSSSDTKPSHLGTAAAVYLLLSNNDIQDKSDSIPGFKWLAENIAVNKRIMENAICQLILAANYSFPPIRCIRPYDYKQNNSEGTSVEQLAEELGIIGI